MSNPAHQPDRGNGASVDPLREREVVCKELETALKAREVALQERAQRFSRWLNPLFLGLIAATIGLVGNIIVTERQARSSLQQERLREQSSLILEAIKTGDADRAATNLDFFIKLGFIDDPTGAIKAFLANRKQLPVLFPASGAVRWSGWSCRVGRNFVPKATGAYWHRRQCRRDPQGITCDVGFIAT